MSKGRGSESVLTKFKADHAKNEYLLDDLRITYPGDPESLFWDEHCRAPAALGSALSGLHVEASGRVSPC
jgi:hypothetical protein